MSELADSKPCAATPIPTAVTSRYQRALPIVAAYALVATLWILFSDAALASVLADPDLLIEWSTYKGLAFVAVTSTLLLVMLLRAFGAIDRSFSQRLAREVEIGRLRQ